MNKHHRPGERTVFIECTLESKVVIIFQSHSSQHDNIDFRLQSDAGKQLIVGLSGRGKNRQLLRFDQCIENIDHGNVGPDHIAGNNALGRIHRRSSDGNKFIGNIRTVVPGSAPAVENPAQKSIGTGNHHLPPQETHLILSTDTPAAGKNLQRNFAAVNTDHLSQRCTPDTGDFSEFIVSCRISFDGDNIAGNPDDLMIYFTHDAELLLQLWR